MEFIAAPASTSEKFTLINGHVCRVEAAHPQIERIYCVTIVNLNDDLKLDRDLCDPSKNKLWFHMQCENHLGATFDIITNGEVFYPVDRYKTDSKHRKHITTTTKPKASVDLAKMNADDKEMINYAIEHFIA